MVIDLGVSVTDPKKLDSFIQMGQKLGFSGLAAPGVGDGPEKHIESGFLILKRADVSGRGLKAIRKGVEGVRRQSMIVSVKLASVETTNWAAEDHKVDLLTVDSSQEHRLRDSTAGLAASSGTALEIRFEPLLHLTGLNRSKVIKTYREAIRTASDAGMQVILSSGAKHPLNMRSAVSMWHIGELLGMDEKHAKIAVNQTPIAIIERNRKRFSSEYVAEGIEIIQKEGK